MDIDEIKRILKKLGKSIPAGIPYAGEVYAQYLSELSSEELRFLFRELQALSKEQYENLTKKLQGIVELNVEQFQLIKLLEEAIEHKYKIPAQKFTAIIPTGGRAGSMYPFNSGMPKSLFIVNTKPILHHILDSLNRDIFSKVIVLTREYSPMIEESLLPYQNFVECIRIDRNVPAALLEIKNKLKSPFLIHYNDILIDEIKWDHVIKHYQFLKERYSVIGMLVCSKYYPLDIGILTEKTADLLESFNEKPDYLIEVYANIGVSIFEPDFLNNIEPADGSIFKESLKRAKDGRKKFGIYKVDRWWHIHDLRNYFDKQFEYYPNELIRQ
jgi:GTP:adenosylcobinamide-phosphate guanylyltransferase